jgi:tetratricopeptide (TPR) repeat protein
MDDILNLFDSLLARARRYHDLGEEREAARLLARLLRYACLPPALVEEASARLAVLCLKRGRFRSARRHLREALRRRPDSARYHHLMARAIVADPSCRGAEIARAMRHYQRALELEPRLIRCRGDAGLLALRLGKVEEGLALLRDAALRAPDDPEAVGKMVKGLRLAGRPEEARAALQSALFRQPRSLRLRQLRADVQVQDLRRRRDEQGGPSGEEAPVVLPFVRRVGEPTAAGRAVRHDAPAILSGPHSARLWRRAR